MASPHGSTTGANRVSRPEWVGLALAATLLVAFRLHAFDLPLETDECNYAYIGSRLLAGDRLYLDVWDHQPFGVFALFAGAIAMFGDAPEVFRWTATAFSLASLALVFAMLRRTASPIAAVAGAFLFAMASSDPGTAGEGCNREIYMNTLILAAWYLAAARGGQNRRVSPCSLFLAGSALAVASAIKTVVAVHWLLLAIWIAWDRAAAAPHGLRIRAATRTIALFAFGPILLWAVAFAYFGGTGRIHEFVDAVFLFNVGYSGGGSSFASRFVDFFRPKRHPFIFDSAMPLWFAGAAGTLWLAFEAVQRRDRTATAVLALVVSGFVAVCLPAHFWPHYYYLMIPPLVIAFALGADRLAGGLRSRRAGRTDFDRSLTWLVYGVIVVGLFFTQYRDYLKQPPFGITVKRYNSRDFWGRAQGENVARVTDPDDEVFVFGNEAEIYYYAQRRCASRYTMVTALQVGGPTAGDRLRTLIDDLKAHPPRLIVVLFDIQDPPEEWKTFLRERYTDPVGWDFHDQTGKPIMFVVARKDRPIAEINWDWDRSSVGGWMLGEQR